jgi:8-oxo-dGTP diphosphatase
MTASKRTREEGRGAREEGPKGSSLVAPPATLEIRHVSLPYKVATLLYCFNERDELLLMERAQEPNLGLWSPCGGKLHTDLGESPYACACREAQEELGVELSPSDLHLAGLVSEHGYQGQSHWLMFLFEVTRKLTSLPPPHREGRFEFFPRTALESLKLPQTDRERIWPWFWQHRGGFFAAHCHCHPDGTNDWTLEERVERRGARADAHGRSNISS